MPIEKNNFNSLVNQIDTVHQTLQAKSVQTVSRSLTLRNWIIGYYIVEYEQKGEDRAKYGGKIIENLVKKLKHIKGMSATNLKLFRLFYSHYPQIGQTVSDQFKLEDFSIQQTMSLKSLKIPPKQLLNACSFSHFIEFLKIDDPLKKLFYEVETIKENWSVRELKRQINSAIYERIGLSKDKNEMIKSIQNSNEILLAEQIIKDPYILEFTGLESKVKYSENDLEEALLNHLQEFLIGLILCANKNETKVEYATAGLDQQLFVSKYKINLPSIEEIEELIIDEMNTFQAKNKGIDNANRKK